MTFGPGVLRLSSEAFWSMTPRELKAAHEGLYGRGATPLSRTDLEGLMLAFPDI